MVCLFIAFHNTATIYGKRSPHVGKNVGNPKDRKKKALNNQGFILGIWWRWRPPYLIPYQSNTDQKP